MCHLFQSLVRKRDVHPQTNGIAVVITNENGLIMVSPHLPTVLKLRQEHCRLLNGFFPVDHAPDGHAHERSLVKTAYTGCR